MNTDLETTKSKPLFGGALSASLPGSFEDISIIREVPGKNVD